MKKGKKGGEHGETAIPQHVLKARWLKKWHVCRVLSFRLFLRIEAPPWHSTPSTPSTPSIPNCFVRCVPQIGVRSVRNG